MPTIHTLRKEFLNCNLRLVFSIAKQYGRKYSIPDLFQEGIFGLYEGLRKFDVDSEYKFSTYCTWWIKHFIRLYIKNKTQEVRLPTNVHDRNKRLAKIKKNFIQCTGRIPTHEELKELSGYTESALTKLAAYEKMVTPISLSSKVRVTKDCTEEVEFESTLTSPNDVEEDSSLQILRDHLYQLLADLPEKERKIILLRYGLLDGEEKSYKYIANIYGLSKERIRQIVNGSLNQLREDIREENPDIETADQLL